MANKRHDTSPLRVSRDISAMSRSGRGHNQKPWPGPLILILSETCSPQHRSGNDTIARPPDTQVVIDTALSSQSHWIQHESSQYTRMNPSRRLQDRYRGVRGDLIHIVASFIPRSTRTTKSLHAHIMSSLFATAGSTICLHHHCDVQGACAP